MTAIEGASSWFVRVRVDVDGEERDCRIGPIDTWTRARGLAERWERAFGAGTAVLDYGALSTRFRFLGWSLRIVPASAPLAGGGWLTRPIRPDAEQVSR